MAIADIVDLKSGDSYDTQGLSLPSTEHTLICGMTYACKILLQYLQRTQFLFLIFNDRLGWYQLLWHARIDQQIVFLRNLYSALFCIKLADSSTLAHGAECELLWLVASKFDNIQPGNGRTFFSVTLQNLRRSIKQSLKSIHEDWTNWSCS